MLRRGAGALQCTKPSWATRGYKNGGSSSVNHGARRPIPLTKSRTPCVFQPHLDSLQNWALEHFPGKHLSGRLQPPGLLRSNRINGSIHHSILATHAAPAVCHPSQMRRALSSKIQTRALPSVSHDEHEGDSRSGHSSRGWGKSTALAVLATCGYGVLADEERRAYMLEKFANIIKIRKIEDSFVLEQRLGEGGFSVVYRGYNKSTRQRVAVKVMKKTNPEVTLVMQDEVELMTAAGKHENLVGLHAVYETPKEWCLILDLADGGALFDRVVAEGTLTENQASNYVLQLMSAILHLHRRNICHGDVKPENLLLSSEGNDDSFANTIKLCDFDLLLSDKEYIKLADFGMARIIGPEGMVLDQHTGTLDYWAPEIVRNQSCGCAIDMWALGVVIYIMLCGCNPFDPYGRASDSQILSNIAKGKLDTRNPVWRHLSEPCRDFIMKLLNVDPAARMTSEEAMQHPWLVQAPSTLLPAVHKQRLMGYQALHNLRVAIQALGVNVDAMFDKMDTKHTGLVDLDKVFSTVGMKLSNDALSAVRELACSSPSDSSGKAPSQHIHLDEFKKVLKLQRGKRQDLGEAQLRQLFDLFDEEKKGKIGPEQLSHVLHALGRVITMRRCTSIVKKGNKLEEQLDFKQFCALMKSHIFEEDKNE